MFGATRTMSDERNRYPLASNIADIAGWRVLIGDDMVDLVDLTGTIRRAPGRTCWLGRNGSISVRRATGSG